MKKGKPRVPFYQETKLEKRRTSRKYRGLLDKSLKAFDLWINRQGCEVDWNSDFGRINQLLVDFIDHLYNENKDKLFSLAKHTVLGIQTRHRHLKTNLKRAWDAVGTWQDERPAGHRTPMPETILNASFLTAWNVASEIPRFANVMIPLAILMRIAWHGLLRVKELLT